MVLGFALGYGNRYDLTFEGVSFVPSLFAAVLFGVVGFNLAMALGCYSQVCALLPGSLLGLSAMLPTLL